MMGNMREFQLKALKSLPVPGSAMLLGPVGLVAQAANARVRAVTASVRIVRMMASYRFAPLAGGVGVTCFQPAGQSFT